MFFKGTGPNSDVIDVDMTEAANPWPQGFRNMSLLYCRSVLYAHRHHCPFIKTPWSVHCHQRDIVRVHAGLKKTICHVNGHKVLSHSKVGEDVIDKGDWETVCNCVSIQLSVVVYPLREYRGIGFRDNKCATAYRG